MIDILILILAASVLLNAILLRAIGSLVLNIERRTAAIERRHALAPRYPERTNP